MRLRIPIFLLLALSISFSIGCVSIPEAMQLVDKSRGQALVHVGADCVADSTARNIKVSSHAEETLDSNLISLLNWNVYKGQRDNWRDDFNQLIQQQDIVLLQEASLQPDLHQALNQKKLNWNLNTAFYYDDSETGVLTASTVKAKRVCGLRAYEPVIHIPKTMLISEYRLSNQLDTLLVANIHGINFTLGTEAYREQIMALTEALRLHNGPVIVAGDFNTWSDSRMEVVEGMVQQLSLKAVGFKSHNRITVFGNPWTMFIIEGLM